jgi:putative membrane protein
MRRTFAIVCFTALALSGIPTLASAEDSKQFVKDVVQSNIAEVKMGELAQQKGTAADVKDFGKMLASDHAKGRDKAIGVAKTMNVDAPKEEKTDATKALERLSGLSGATFDRDFTEHMVMVHQKNVESFEKHIKEGDSAEAKQMATEMLPTLKLHLETAKTLHTQVSRPAPQTSR